MERNYIHWLAGIIGLRKHVADQRPTADPVDQEPRNKACEEEPQLEET